MNWQDRISSDPEVLAGKPAGTRLAVEFLLGLFGEGWSTEEVLDSYPRLTRDDLQAVFAYAAAALRGQRGIPQSAIESSADDW